MTKFKSHLAPAILLAAVGLAGCGGDKAQVEPIRPVRAVTVDERALGETVSMTGQIRAQYQANLAFRIDGRLIERRAWVGDSVKAGQVIGRLDPQIEQNNLRQAQAALSAAQAQLVQARSTFQRQQSLLKDGWTPRAQFDAAQQGLESAEAQVESARAQLKTAQEQLGFTELRADSAGTITAVGAEPGEVVAAGRMVIQIARQGGLDAVFDVPAQILRSGPPDVQVEIAMTDDPTITCKGRVREVAPEADPATRTFAVKVGLIDPPEAMRLGATVSGRVTLQAPPGVEIPASALTEAQGRPAVWTIDSKTHLVALRDVTLLRHDAANIVVSRGLERGDVVVTAGTQVLRPGQKVRILSSLQ